MNDNSPWKGEFLQLLQLAYEGRAENLFDKRDYEAISGLQKAELRKDPKRGSILTRLVTNYKDMSPQEVESVKREVASALGQTVHADMPILIATTGNKFPCEITVVNAKYKVPLATVTVYQGKNGAEIKAALVRPKIDELPYPTLKRITAELTGNSDLARLANTKLIVQRSGEYVTLSIMAYNRQGFEKAGELIYRRNRLEENSGPL